MLTVKSIFELLFIYSFFYIANCGCRSLEGKHKICGIYIKLPKVISYILFYYPKLWLDKNKKIIIHCVIYQFFFQINTIYTLIKLLLLNYDNYLDLLSSYAKMCAFAFIVPLLGQVIGRLLYERKRHTSEESLDQINRRKEGRDD